MDTVAGMRIFAGVVESGSFSAAGRQVGLAPSSVSRRIGDLEDELGARLFHRTTRKLSLTEAGQIYFERAARILIEIDEAKLAVARSDGAPSGVLRLTAPASVARRHIVPALGDFQARYPAVQIVLSMTDRLVDLVEDRFDLAIRLGAQSDSSLIARKIGSGRRFVAASPAYLDRAGVPGTPAELADHNCLTFRSHRGSNLWRFRGGRGESQVRVTGSLFSDNGEALCAAAVSGLGLILVPEWLTGSEVKQGRLRELLSGWRALPEATPLYAVYPHQRHLPAKVRSFIDFLAQRFAAQSGWDGGT
ncbi:MAG: LysR family transcriptional regulator [Alphaproteobacteria bacterium]